MRALLLLVFLVGCGGRPPVPNRVVIEKDLGGWKFRRFQGPNTDIEVWVTGNAGQAYAATYITSDAEKRGQIDDKDLVSVVVTKYEKPDGVTRATVKLARRLASEHNYTVEEHKVSGTRALRITSANETWVMWPSNGYVVKVGGERRKDVPDSMVGYYADVFPSSLPGGALEGPLPPGPDDAPKKDKKEPYDPKNPKPDLDRYDPKKAKLPDKKSESQ